MRLTLGKLAHVYEAQHLRDPASYLRLRQLVLLQAEGNVLLYGHVRKERVGLEHHIDGAQVGRHVGQVNAVQHNLPGGRLLETCQHTQQG